MPRKSSPTIQVAALSALVILTVSGCAAEPGTGFCESGSPPTLSIEAPSAGSVIDRDNGVAPGLQTDIAITTTLEPGTALELWVGRDGEDPVAAPGTVVVAADGRAWFREVTLPAGPVTVAVSGVDDCGSASASVSLTVLHDPNCDLALSPQPAAVDYYGPVRVFNAASDPSPILPGHQVLAAVSSAPGAVVQLTTVDLQNGREVTTEPAAVDAAGRAQVELSLADGYQSIRAVCASPQNTTTASSATQVVFVDLEAPACDIRSPESVLTPAFDSDPERAGTQVVIAATVQGAGDVEGEPTAWSAAGGPAADGSAVDAEGNAFGLFELTGTGEYTVAMAARDHAGNTCATAAVIAYEHEGCSMVWNGPQGPVTADDNPDATGLQVATEIAVDERCAGQLLTATCGEQVASQLLVPPGGVVSTQLTLCDQAECEIEVECSFTIETPAGNATALVIPVAVDTLPPEVDLYIADREVNCGAVVDATRDANAEVAGVQLNVGVQSVGAVHSWIEVSQFGADPQLLEVDEFGTAQATIASGQNYVVARAEDAVGNVQTTLPCPIALADLAVMISSPPDGALLGRADGTQTGSALLVDVCGTVGDPNAQVALRVDGGEAAPVQPDPSGAWCAVGVLLPESATGVQLTATADANGRVGSTSAQVRVDLTPPAAPADVRATALSRQVAELAWNASEGAVDYLIRVDSAPFTDESFGSSGQPFGPPVAASTGPLAVEVDGLRPGAPVYVGVAARDAAGNLAVTSVGPVSVSFTRSDSHRPADTDAVDFGSAMAGADLNDDGLSDLIVGAPSSADGGRVYVYLGTPNGLPAIADYRLVSNDGGFFGFSLSTPDWNGDGTRDLAVGAPFQDGYNGRVVIFFGGESFAAGAGVTQEIEQSFASATTCGDGTEPCGTVIETDGADWFTYGGFGWSLAAVQFDSGTRDDLVIGVPGANAPTYTGGAVVVLGGSTARTIALSQTAPLTAGVRAFYADFSDAALYAQFGASVTGLGRVSSGARDDIAIAPLPEISENDRVYVLRGRDHGGGDLLEALAFGGQDLEIVESPGTQFGRAVATVGDITGDGVPDLAFSASKQSPARVYVASGAASGPAVDIATLNPLIIEGGAGFGSAIANAASGGDVDGDGRRDLLIAGGVSNPKLHVFYGGAIPTAQTISSDAADYLLDAPDEFARVSTIAWIGDFDGDQLEDLGWADDEVSETTGGMVEVMR